MFDVYDVIPGLFSTCSSYWDEKQKKFIVNDYTDLAKCCVSRCVKPVEFCHEYCIKNYNDKNLENCLETCNDQRTMCIDTCKFTSKYVDTDNQYIECANNAGCEGIRGRPDINCLKKHREKIYDCCVRNCFPNSRLNCQKHCKFLEEVSINPEKVGIPYEIYEVSQKEYSNNYRLLYLVLALFILFGLMYIIMKLTRKE